MASRSGRTTDRAGLIALMTEWRTAIVASKKPFLLSLAGPQFCRVSSNYEGCAGEGRA